MDLRTMLVWQRMYGRVQMSENVAENNGNKQQKRGQFLMFFCFIVIGGICGLWISMRLDFIQKEELPLYLRLGDGVLMMEDAVCLI